MPPQRIRYRFPENNFVSSPSLNNGLNNNVLGTTNVNGVGTLLTVNQNQQQNQQDSYGSPQGNVITGNNIGGQSNINNFGRGTVSNVDPGLTNSVSSSLTLASPVQSFNNGINNNNLNNFTFSLIVGNAITCCMIAI